MHAKGSFGGPFFVAAVGGGGDAMVPKCGGKAAAEQFPAKRYGAGEKAA
jgi:hypothetical protein